MQHNTGISTILWVNEKIEPTQTNDLIKLTKNQQTNRESMHQYLSGFIQVFKYISQEISMTKSWFSVTRTLHSYTVKSHISLYNALKPKTEESSKVEPSR